MTGRSTEVRKFTGRHATMIIVAFFAVVVGVNMVMARFALSTFSGTVVDNSYVASQKYNDWLEQARDQQAHGWTISPAVRKDGRASLTITESEGADMAGATLSAIAEHPIGRAEPFEISFAHIGAGDYQSIEPLPAGRWKLKIIVTRGDKIMRVIRDIR